MPEEDQEKKPKRTRKPKEVAPPPVPGTDASEPADLLGDVPDPEAEVAEAEEILNGEKKPEIAGPESQTVASVTTATGPEADDNEQFLNDLFALQEEAIFPSELSGLLETIREIAPKHATAAARAGQRSIATDFSALVNVAKHLAKKTQGVRYWKAV